MKKLFLLLLFAIPLYGQGARFEGNVVQTATVAGVPNVLTSVSTAQISVCVYPANSVPCTNKATTYPLPTLVGPCSTAQQLTLPGSSSCTSITDPLGNWGVWVPSGTFSYTITIAGVNLGPYTFSVGATGNGGIINVTVAPSGSCSPGATNQQVISTGVIYSCQGGTWGAVGGGLSGLTPGNVPVANSANTANSSVLPSTTVNGQVCALGASCSITSGSATAPFVTLSPTPATSGTLRLANNEAGICWRNPANTADVCVTLNSLGQFTSGGSFTTADDYHFKGPNPYVGAETFGVRASIRNATPNIPGVTLSITGGTNTGTINTNTCASQTPTTCFQKGDSITALGGGGANGISTPAAPTVTPANAVGETNTGLFVASPAGGTSYQFCLSALGQASQTACSAFGTTATGQATLGPITSSISSASLSNSTMTVVTSVALSISPGATCQLYSMAPNIYNFEGQVATVSGTTLTFTMGSADTRNGAAPVATTLGTIVCWNQIHVKAAGLPAGANTSTVLAVYGGAGAAQNLLGFMKPAGNLDPSDSTYLVFDWYGSTFSPVGAQPFFVASTAPVAATKEAFNTTIDGVSGTTLTFHTNATTTLAGATILLDQSTNINSCLVALLNTSSKCRLPATSAGYFVLNSKLTIPNNTVLETAGANGNGGIWANDTIIFQANSADILGVSASGQQNGSQFALTHYPTIDCGNAWPCMISLGKTKLDLLKIGIPDGGLGYVQVAGQLLPAYDWNYIYWDLGGNGYSSIAYYCSGTHTGTTGAIDSVFKGMNFNAAQLGFGSMQTPAFISSGCGNWSFPETFFSGKGRFWRPPTPGMSLDVNTLQYSQANYMPFDTIYNVDGSLINVNLTQHGPVGFDTTFAPMVATNSGIRLNIFSDGATPTPTSVLMTGNGNIYLQNGPGGSSGQNLNQVQGPTEAGIADPILGYAFKGVVKQDADLGVSALYSIHTVENPPAAPTCPVSLNGLVPVGTHSYQYAYVYPDGGQGTLSNVCTATTTSGSPGNQTVTVTAPLQAGVTYAFYRDGTLANAGGCAVNQSTSNVFIDTFSFTCGNTAPTFADSGPAGMRGTLAWSVNYGLNGYIDAAEITPPANPPAGKERWFPNLSTHQFSCITSSGSSCAASGGAVAPPPLSVQYNNSGVAGGIPVPTSPNGVAQVLASTPSGGVGVVSAFKLAGVVPRVTACPSNLDTVLATDRAGFVEWNDTVACAVTLPQAGSGSGTNNDFTNNFVFLGCNIGVGIATITPTISTLTVLNNGVVSTPANIPLSKGQCAFFYSDNTNYTALQVTSTGLSQVQTNTVNNTSQTLLNLTNSAVTNGITLTVTNTGGGVVQLGYTGTLNNSGLTNSATTVNGQTCTLGSTCTVPPGTITIANAGVTGTTVNTITKLIGAPSTAVITATTDTSGAIGITTSGAGTAGNAVIQLLGSVSCVFDGATIAGDYVQISSTVVGNCHDASATYPTSGQVIGRVLSTNGAGGTFTLDLFPQEISSSTNSVTAASSATAAKQVCVSSGASKTCSYIDYPETFYVPAANCVNANAASAWSTAATPAALCRAGTNNKDGLLSPWGASDVGYFKVHLPNDWDSTASLDVSIDLTSTDVTNGHTIIMQASTTCAKGDGSTTDDVAFNAAQAFSTITLNGNANRTWNSTLTGLTKTGCIAGSTLWVKVSRTTDTATNVGVYGATVDVARLITVQAN